MSRSKKREKKCNVCSKFLSDKYCEVEGKFYCQVCYDCLVCNVCSEILSIDFHFEVDDKFFCQECYNTTLKETIRVNEFFDLKKSILAYMADTKLVKTIMDAATLTGLAVGIGWIGKKVVKQNMNYVKFTAVMAGSIAP